MKLPRVEPDIEGTKNAKQRATARKSATVAMYQSYVYAHPSGLLDPTGFRDDDPIHPIAMATSIQSIQNPSGYHPVQ
jgi:hypothetical protein